LAAKTENTLKHAYTPYGSKQHFIGTCVFAAVIFMLLALTIPFARAQTPPTVEQVQEQANGIISALRTQRDDANDRLAQAMAANAKLTRDLDAAKKAAEPKKDDAK
jgi:hypothetical protein